MMLILLEEWILEMMLSKVEFVDILLLEVENDVMLDRCTPWASLKNE